MIQQLISLLLICHRQGRRRSGGLMDVVFNYYIILFSFLMYFLLSLSVFVCLTRKYSTKLVTPFPLPAIFLKFDFYCLSIFIEQVTKQFNCPLYLFVLMILITIAFSYVCIHLLCEILKLFRIYLIPTCDQRINEATADLT